MNKKLSIIALTVLMCISRVSAQEIAISSTFAFESEYVFRGVQFADSSFQPAIDLSYGDFYLGTWVNSPIVDGVGFNNEVDFYGGYGFAPTDWLSIDLGLTYYWFPEDPSSDSYSRELYIGFAADVALAPSVYFYYDFDLEGFTLQFSGGHSFDMSESIPNSSIDVGFYVGGVYFDVGTDYVYYGGSIDWSYAFNDNASISFGMRVSSTDLSGVRDGNFWWGSVFSAGF